jgi:thiamine pyrophosphate-dependent acetolactate synthase large subunit-like protein
MVNRALSFAMSDPKGPVYLYGAREPMEEDLEPYKLDQSFWNPVEPAALSPNAVKTISEALVNAQEPLLITGYSGRNHAAVAELIELADNIKGLRVLDTGGSDMCFPGRFNIRARTGPGRQLTYRSKPPRVARTPLRYLSRNPNRRRCPRDRLRCSMDKHTLPP